MARLLPLFFLFLSALIGGTAWPQASVNVSLLDPVYRDIDKLVAHGLVDVIIVGQRPYSRREIAKITAQALSHLNRITDPLADPNASEKKKRSLQGRLDYVEGILARMKRDYREELIQLGALSGEVRSYSFHPIEKVHVEAVVTNSPPEPLASENGLGQIDAVINPLVDYRQGRHIVDGATLSLETAHWLRASRYFALYLKPRFQLGIANFGDSDENRVDILNLYGKIWVKNFEIQIGRDNQFWGQGKDAGILLSNNPRGLDFGKISNDSPFFFPWVFRYMGANKFSFFYADLGPEQNFPHAYLTGYKWNLQPLRFFEVGAGLLVHAGGEGSPPASLGEQIGNLFRFNPTEKQIGNIIGGFEIRFRIPPLRGTELYAEAMFDDRHNSFFSRAQLDDDAGYIAGLYLPRVDNEGSLDLRFEYHRMGKRFYRHSVWTSGWTLNQFIIGNNLGPDAQGFYISSRWDVDSKNLLTFEGAFESRSRDIWAVDDPHEFNFKKIEDFPDERRFRGTAAWQHRLSDLPMRFVFEVGYERVQNFNFTTDNSRNNFLGQFALELTLDSFTRFPRSLSKSPTGMDSPK